MIFETLLTSLLTVSAAASAALEGAPERAARPVVTPSSGAAVRLLAQASSEAKTGKPAPKLSPAPAAEKPAAIEKAPAAAPKAAAAPDTANKSPANAADSAKNAAPAPQMKPEVRVLVDRMQAFYEKTADFTADFEQKYTYKQFKRTQTSSGSVIFKKPALMRWEYAKPSKKTFILAGEKVYAYDPEAQLVTVANVGANQLSASVTFLWGQGKLQDEFAIEQIACKSCTGTLLQLTPLKPDPRFRRILLEVDPKTAQVLKSTVIDPDGSENAITFKNLKTNTGVATTAFKIDYPAGTQVQDFTKAAAADQQGGAKSGGAR